MDRRRSNSGGNGGGTEGLGTSGSWSSLRKPIDFYDENARAHADGIESVLIHPNGRSVFTKGFDSVKRREGSRVGFAHRSVRRDKIRTIFEFVVVDDDTKCSERRKCDEHG